MRVSRYCLWDKSEIRPQGRHLRVERLCSQNVSQQLCGDNAGDVLISRAHGTDFKSGAETSISAVEMSESNGWKHCLR